MPPNTRHTTLLESTSTFCTALLHPPPPATLLATHFTSTPTIHEHGPSWASTRLPFLGRPFVGVSGCLMYFSLLADTLSMELPLGAFPGEGGFVVDADADAGAGAVSVVGKGRFTSAKTGRSWEERFIYRFSRFDEQGRIGTWEVWADPLSAWVACGEEDPPAGF